jgi:hypothetical protein
VLAVINAGLKFIKNFYHPITDWLLGGCALLKSTINLKNCKMRWLGAYKKLQDAMAGGLLFIAQFYKETWIQVRSATLINESKKAEDALVSKAFLTTTSKLHYDL